MRAPAWIRRRHHTGRWARGASLAACVAMGTGCDDGREPGPARVTAIVVQGPDSLEVGQRGTVTLTLHDAQGATLPLPPNGTWSISDTSVARLIGVDAGGAALETRATGVVTVTARAYAVTEARTIRVLPSSERVASSASPASTRVSRHARRSRLRRRQRP